MRPEQERAYARVSSVVFLKTDAPFGGLSNMAPGYPLRVNGIRILTSEALYQACRFPHRPEIQRLIIEQKSPMTAKMKSKPYRPESRSDWDQVRVKIMRWCLRVKLAQNWRNFSDLLLETDARPIVEESRKDEFWGAKATDGGTLIGMNVLGRLLMELREAVKAASRESLTFVQPIAIPVFLLDGRPIEVITALANERGVPPVRTETIQSRGEAGERPMAQPSLFDRAAAKEVSPPAFREDSAAGIHIGELKPYTEYKDSGLPWLGQVPRHWVVKRAKSIFKRIDERSKTGREELLTVSSARGVVPRRTVNVTMFKAESYLGYKLCWPGDLVINSLWAWAGGLGVSRCHGIVSSAYGVYRAREVASMIPAFVHEVVRSSSFSWELRVRSKGVWISRLQLTDISFLDAPIHIPPPAEQVAIVRFLDWANGWMERAIRAKRKVIGLLNEQKQAIIHLAVTRGLDPSVALKPSGIAWLGDIPQHWEVRRFKMSVGFQEGPGIMLSDFREAGVPLLRISCLAGQEATLNGCNYLSPAKVREKWSHFAVRPGDYLLSASGSTGAVRRASEEVVGAIPYTGIIRLWPKSPVIDMEYLRLFMSARPFAQQILMAKSGVGIEHFGPTHLKRMWILQPSLEEQRAIVAGVSDATAGLDTAVSHLEREIELLREYRTRLVADVTTGKLDVREAAARLPDEAPPDTVEEIPDLTDEAEAIAAEAVV